MRRLAIMTRDDRGREVRLWQLPRQRGAAADSEVPEYIRARLTSDLAFATKRTTLYMLLALVAAQVLAMIWLSRLPTGVAQAIFVGAMLTAVFVQQRYVRGRTAAATRATLLAECHCASCGYDLVSIPEDRAAVDGCTVCPECESAWRLDRARSLRLAPAAETAAPHRDIGEPSVPEQSSARPLPTIRQSLRWFFGLQRHHRWRGFLAGADDRGAVVELASPRIKVRPPREWASVPEDAQGRIRSELAVLGLGWRVLAGAVGIPSLLLLAGMQFYLGALGVRVSRVLVFIGLFHLFWLGALVWFVVHPYVRRPRQVVDIFLREGLCPSCATDLSGVRRPRPEAAVDGCVVCPTCHAAWRVAEAG